MSGFSPQFSGLMLPPKALINASSAAGAAADLTVGAGTLPGCKLALSGALVAGVLSTVLDLSGPGVVSFSACASVDATARTHRLKCTIDGVVVFDFTTASVSAANRGIYLVGTIVGAGFPGLSLVPFNQSFKLEYASSLTETDKTNHFFQYRMG